MTRHFGQGFGPPTEARSTLPMQFDIAYAFYIQTTFFELAMESEKANDNAKSY
jgi:hypothetical protein